MTLDFGWEKPIVMQDAKHDEVPVAYIQVGVYRGHYKVEIEHISLHYNRYRGYLYTPDLPYTVRIHVFSPSPPPPPFLPPPPRLRSPHPPIRTAVKFLKKALRFLNKMLKFLRGLFFKEASAFSNLVLIMN